MSIRRRLRLLRNPLSPQAIADSEDYFEILIVCGEPPQEGEPTDTNVSEAEMSSALIGAINSVIANAPE